MRSCIGRVSGPGLSSRNCQSAVCAADKRHERSGGRLWATSRNRGRAYHPLFGALALGSKNIGRLGGTVALLIDRSWFSSHIICTSFLKGNAHRSGQAVGVLPLYKYARVCYIIDDTCEFVVVLTWRSFQTQEVLFFFLLREALVTSVAGVFRFMCSWWSSLRQRGVGCTSASSLHFADVYGRTVKKKADTHGYISVSTG